MADVDPPELDVIAVGPPSHGTQSCALDWHHRWGPLDPQANSAVPIGRVQNVIASFDHDPDRCRHAGLEQ